MTKTIVGLFDSRTTARTVADDLEASGFRRSDIDISQAGAAAEPEPRRDEGGFWNWFLGADDFIQERYTYDEGFRRGRAAVAVTVDDTSVGEAEAIMSRHHPLDLDIEARQWRQEGWTGGGDIPVAESTPPRGGVRMYSRPAQDRIIKARDTQEEEPMAAEADIERLKPAPDKPRTRR